MAEYVKIDYSDKIDGAKDLLESQMALIEAIKIYTGFEKLRKEEMILKIALKNKIGELFGEMNVLKKLLPGTKLKEGLQEEDSEWENDLVNMAEKAPAKIKRDGGRDLESELDEIRRKLEAMQ